MSAARPIISRLGWMAYAVAAVVVVLDQVSKAWILGPFDLMGKGSVQVLPFFRLTFVPNPGVSFGLLRAHGDFGRWMLVLFAMLVVAAIAFMVRRATSVFTAIGMGLVMGGAIGNNVIDRVRWGEVTDFLDFTGLGFKWVFNVADSAISVGVAVLVLELLLAPRPPKAPARS
jgi:signal peptidase II